MYSCTHANIWLSGIGTEAGQERCSVMKHVLWRKQQVPCAMAGGRRMENPEVGRFP